MGHCQSYARLVTNCIQGLHWAQDMRTADPKSFYVYYPCIMPQDEIEEAVHFLQKGGIPGQSMTVTRPPAYEEFGERESYDPKDAPSMESFGPTVRMPLGNIAIGRSGDKVGAALLSSQCTPMR